MARVLLALVPFIWVTLSAGCYQSHGLSSDASVDAADAFDGRVDAFDAGFDAPSRPDAVDRPDARPDVFDAGDPGPPRELEWTLINEAGPPPRYNHAAVYDAARDRMLVWGGFDPYGPDGGCCLPEYLEHQDLWSLDLRTGEWTELPALGQTLFAAPTEVAIAGGRAVFIAHPSLNESASGLFALDLQTYELSRLANGPWPAGHSPLRAAWNRADDTLVVQDAVREDVAPGLWIFDLASNTWSTRETTNAPTFRFHTPLTRVGRDYLMFGGFGYVGDLTRAELWRLRDGRWGEVPLNMPGGRNSHRVIYEARRQTFVVLGGSRGTVARATMVIDLEAGLTTEPELVPALPPRRDFTAVLDTRRRQALVFGGAFQSSFAYGDTWALRLP